MIDPTPIRWLHKGLVALCLAASTTACLKGPQFLEQGGAAAVELVTSEEGDLSGRISSSVVWDQVLRAVEDSTISGSEVIFPPGALAIPADVVLGEGVDAGGADVLTQLGLDLATTSSVGASLSILTTTNTDPVVPLSISLPLPASSGLWGGLLSLFEDNSQYAVSFVGTRVTTNETFVGIIPSSEIDFLANPGKATFKTETWGTYQLIVIEREEERPAEKKVIPAPETKPVLRSETKAIPPLRITSRSPLHASTGDTVIVKGTNFAPDLKLRVGDQSWPLTPSADGTEVIFRLPDISSSSAASRFLRNGTGFVGMALAQEGSSAAFNILVRPADTAAYVMASSDDKVCDGESYVHSVTGEIRKGTRNCSGTVVAECTANNQTGCKTTSVYKSADLSGLEAGNIKSGVTIAGVSGSLSGAPANCARDGDTACVATSQYKAADVTGLATKVVSGSTVAGTQGTVVLPPAANVLSGERFGAASSLTGTLSLPAAANVRASAGRYGVGGTSVTPTLADCSADGSVDCVTNQSYKSAKMASVTAGNIKSGVTIAGVAGNLAGSPALCSDSGQQGCVASGDFFAGKECTANGSKCFVPDFVAPRVLKAIDFTSIDRKKMLDTLTIAGVTGDIVSNRSWDVQDAFPGIGYYTGITNIPLPDKFLEGQRLFGSYGSAASGNNTPDCSEDGAQECVVRGDFYGAQLCDDDGDSKCYLPNFDSTNQDSFAAVQLRSINPDKMLKDYTLLGKSGAIENRQTWDINNSLFPGSGYYEGIIPPDPAKIKRGVNIVGVVGTFPSEGNPLPRFETSAHTDTTTYGNDETDLTNFTTQLTTDDTFEFWDSNGKRYTGSGDSDIVGEVVKSGVVFENLAVTGTYTGDGSTGTGVGSIDPWNIRAGVSIGGVTGKLKVNCRNAANPAVQETITVTSTGTLNGFIRFAFADFSNFSVGQKIKFTSAPPGGLTANTDYYVVAVSQADLGIKVATQVNGTALSVSGGSPSTVDLDPDRALDVWDTIDDYNNGGTVALTAQPSGWSPENYCGGIDDGSAASAEKVWKVSTGTEKTGTDKISGLMWSNSRSGALWKDANSGCQGLSWGGLSDWRLPTQKELMDAYSHGIRSAAMASSGWISITDGNYLWSATSVYAGNIPATDAFAVNLAKGLSEGSLKTMTKYYVCVRP